MRRLHPILIAIPFVVVGILGLGSGGWLTMVVTAALLAYGLHQVSPARDPRNQLIAWGSLGMMALMAFGSQFEGDGHLGPRISRGFPMMRFATSPSWIAAVVLMAGFAYLIGRLRPQFESRGHAIFWALLGAIGMIGVGTGQFLTGILAGGLAVWVEALMRNHGSLALPGAPPTGAAPAPPPPPASSSSPSSPPSSSFAFAAPRATAGAAAVAPFESRVSTLALLAFALAVVGCVLVVLAIAAAMVTL
jgi:hypothetical protein